MAKNAISRVKIGLGKEVYAELYSLLDHNARGYEELGNFKAAGRFRKAIDRLLKMYPDARDLVEENSNKFREGMMREFGK